GDEEGHGVRCAWAAIDVLGERFGVAVAVSLIVHELGHVHSWAEKRVGALPRKEEDAYRRAIRGDQFAIDTLEQLVDARMENWGVDPKPLHEANALFLEVVRRHLKREQETS